MPKIIAFIWRSLIVNFWITLFRMLIVIQPQRLTERAKLSSAMYIVWFLKELVRFCRNIYFNLVSSNELHLMEVYSLTNKLHTLVCVWTKMENKL